MIAGGDERFDLARTKQPRAAHRRADIEGPSRLEDDMRHGGVQFRRQRVRIGLPIQRAQQHLGAGPCEPVGVVHEHSLRPAVWKLVDEKRAPRPLVASRRWVDAADPHRPTRARCACTCSDCCPVTSVTARQ